MGSINDPRDFIGMFYGPNKIVDITALETRTPSGEPHVKVSFENHSIIVPLRTLALCATKEISDYTTLRNTKFSILIPEMIKVIQEYDLSVAEIEPLLRDVATQLDNRFNRAFNYLWTKDDTKYIPNWNPRDDATLIEADQVIAAIPMSK